jgi:putative transposase
MRNEQPGSPKRGDAHGSTQPRQLELPVPAAWGGARRGSGQKRTSPRPCPPHRSRPELDVRHPVHVTLRGAPSVPSFRSTRVFKALRRALGASNRAAFRVIHFSIQLDHVHLIVEADSARAFAKGMRGLATRCALAVNRADRRGGRVWDRRYHTHELRTPSEVRRAMIYVLLNFRKHLRAAPAVDPRSSGVWFEGWAEEFEASDWPRLAALPRTWLGAFGWRRAGGAISVREPFGVSRKHLRVPRKVGAA